MAGFNIGDLIRTVVGQDPDAGGSTVEGVTATAPASTKQYGNTSGAVAPDMGNNRYLQQAQSALEAAPEHKGMFGVKGTLRDILGTLGDAFLVQSGNKAVYQPNKQKERESDALGGFTQDPLGALERLSQVNPEAAQKAYQAYQTDQTNMQTRTATNENTAALRVAQAQRLEEQRQENFTKTVGGLVSGITTKEEYKRARELAGKLALKRGYDIDDYLDPEFSSGAVKVGGRLGKTGHQITTEEQGQARNSETAEHNDAIEATGRENAASNRKRAERGPAPKNPTDASIAGGLLDKVQRGVTLTPGEEEVLQRTGHGKDRGKKSSLLSSIGAPPPTSGGKYVMRNGKLVKQ